MSKNKRRREIIPPWNMPSDPVKAVWWFMHWLLKVLVRFFWLPILVMVFYEVFANLSISGVGVALIEGGITLLVGVAIWGILYAILVFINISAGIQQVVSDIGRFQRQGALYQRNSSPFMDAMGADTEADVDDHVVEGTITDLEEERNKRRRD
ncbi:MAG: hypothetical protein NVS2B12_10850 [Ktedonobacteraceae bacterium]